MRHSSKDWTSSVWGVESESDNTATRNSNLLNMITGGETLRCHWVTQVTFKQAYRQMYFVSHPIDPWGGNYLFKCATFHGSEVSFRLWSPWGFTVVFQCDARSHGGRASAGNANKLFSNKHPTNIMLEEFQSIVSSRFQCPHPSTASVHQVPITQWKSESS